MSKSASLRLRDVRAAFRLIGDCRDLADDPALWQPRMFEGLDRLLGAAASSGGEGMWPYPRPVQAVTTFDTFEPSTRRHFAAYMQEDGPGRRPSL
jgi:hypothetical protein